MTALPPAPRLLSVKRRTRGGHMRTSFGVCHRTSPWSGRIVARRRSLRRIACGLGRDDGEHRARGPELPAVVVAANARATRSAVVARGVIVSASRLIRALVGQHRSAAASSVLVTCLP
jgi:hypothetical protein